MNPNRKVAVRLCLSLATCLSVAQCGGGAGSSAGGGPGIPIPSGIYVLNEASNGQSTATAYAAGMVAAPAYASDVTGHAIFVPIAKILPSVTTC